MRHPLISPRTTLFQLPFARTVSYAPQVGLDILFAVNDVFDFLIDESLDAVLVHQNLSSVIPAQPQSMRFALWHSVLGSRLRGNDRRGVLRIQTGCP